MNAERLITVEGDDLHVVAGHNTLGVSLWKARPGESLDFGDMHVQTSQNRGTLLRGHVDPVERHGASFYYDEVKRIWVADEQVWENAAIQGASLIDANSIGSVKIEVFDQAPVIWRLAEIKEALRALGIEVKGLD